MSDDFLACQKLPVSTCARVEIASLAVLNIAIKISSDSKDSCKKIPARCYRAGIFNYAQHG
jgi:hypothetical protein